MKQSTRTEIVQGVCVVLILISSIYLTPRLERMELLAWGICCLAILVGSLVEAYKDIDKFRKEQEKLRAKEKLR